MSPERIQGQCDIKDGSIGNKNNSGGIKERATMPFSVGSCSILVGYTCERCEKHNKGNETNPVRITITNRAGSSKTDLSPTNSYTYL